MADRIEIIEGAPQNIGDEPFLDLKLWRSPKDRNVTLASISLWQPHETESRPAGSLGMTILVRSEKMRPVKALNRAHDIARERGIRRIYVQAIHQDQAFGGTDR